MPASLRRATGTGLRGRFFLRSLNSLVQQMPFEHATVPSVDGRSGVWRGPASWCADGQLLVPWPYHALTPPGGGGLPSHNRTASQRPHAPIPPRYRLRIRRRARGGTPRLQHTAMRKAELLPAGTSRSFRGRGSAGEDTPASAGQARRGLRRVRGGRGQARGAHAVVALSAGVGTWRRKCGEVPRDVTVPTLTRRDSCLRPSAEGKTGFVYPSLAAVPRTTGGGG